MRDFWDDGIHYKQVARQRAKKEFLRGKGICVVAKNLRPVVHNGSSTIYQGHVLRDSDKKQFYVDKIGAANYFDEYVASYEHYNCNQSSGREAIFFLMKC